MVFNGEDLILSPLTSSITRTISKVIIHCVGNKYKIGRHLRVKELDKMHLKRGFHRQKSWIQVWRPNIKAAGYHYMIQPNGRIVALRHPSEKGAHCGPSGMHYGQNFCSIGILMVTNGPLTMAQWESLKRLVLKIKVLHNVTVHGHNEFSAHKTCPNFPVNLWLLNDMNPLTKYTVGG